MKRVETEIGDGDIAVRYTLRNMMCRLAQRDAQDRRIKRLANQLSAGKDPLAAVYAAFRHVVQNIRYANDPVGVEQVTAPIFTLGLATPKLPFGDCDDLCTALAALLLAMGVPVSFRVIAWRLDEYTHVSCIAHLPGGVRLPLDPVMGMAGYGNHKTEGIRREEEYRCTMKGVTLEDRSLSGCGCHKRRPRKQGCCPQNGASAPVNVNVITSGAGQDFSRRADVYTDNSSANALIRGGSSYLQPVEQQRWPTQVAPSPIPSAPPPVRHIAAAPYVNNVAPQYVAPEPSTSTPIFRPEFY